jgi:methionyl-tRNA formyltransferase
MTPDIKIGLHVMSAKGYAVLQRLLEQFGPRFIAYVVTARDQAVTEDYHYAIEQLARSAGLPLYTRPAAPGTDAPPPYLFAVSWRWLIHSEPYQQLIVFHDSILPRYRGFAPLVNTLINGESHIGVTALLASAEYDRGAVLAQRSVSITYPQKVSNAIETLTPCYQQLAVEVGSMIMKRNLIGQPQDESLATYSLWRDDYDYFIDWTQEADQIRRFVDAVGFPYLGAATKAHGMVYRIIECSAMADVFVENRTPGKVIFLQDKEPVIVCGRGLLRVHKMIEDESRKNALPLKQFRTCFHSPPRS